MKKEKKLKYHILYVKNSEPKVYSFNTEQERTEFIYSILPEVDPSTGYFIDLIFDGDIIVNGYRS